MCFVSPRSNTTPSPSGSCISHNQVSDLPFHLCNQIEVQDHIRDSLKSMFTTNWPTPTPQAWKNNPSFCELYALVKAKNLPNALGARVILPSGLNIRAWIDSLHDYHDNQICHFLAFGWPIGYYFATIPKSVDINHPSATTHPEHVNNFLQVEKQHRAIAGPFDSLPFKPWTRLSPLMSRPKKGTKERRIIVDLSFPQGEKHGGHIARMYPLGRKIPG